MFRSKDMDHETAWTWLWETVERMLTLSSEERLDILPIRISPGDPATMGLPSHKLPILQEILMYGNGGPHYWVPGISLDHVRR